MPSTVSMTTNTSHASDSNTQHPSDERMAAYLDGRLSGTERDSFVDHLTDCPTCRSEVRGARAANRWAPGTSRMPRLAIFGALAAALVFTLVPLQRQFSRRFDPESGVERRTPTDAIPRIDALAPTGDRAHNARDLTFIWRAESRDAEYRLSLQDLAGRLVWSISTSDTTLALPSDLELSAGSYFWTVDVLRADGRTATTGVQRLTVK